MMPGLEKLLSRLRNVKRTGPGRWIASAPTREDKHPSLAICESDNGNILLYDFGGASFFDILDAVGMSASELFPDKLPNYPRKHKRHFLPAADILRCIAFEALVVSMAATKKLDGPLSDIDRERLYLASIRIQAALSMVA